jgi:uncharacterized membrane protein YbaN (DUF454 family)
MDLNVKRWFDLQTGWGKILQRIFRIAAGVVLIAIGLLGLALPIMPGWILIIIGVMLIAPGSRMARWIKQVAAKGRAKWMQHKRSV